MTDDKKGFAKMKEEGRDEEISDIASKGGQASSQKQDMSELGEQGGKAAQASGHAHQLTDDERIKGGRAAQDGGNAHELTDEERSRGGKIGGSK